MTILLDDEVITTKPYGSRAAGTIGRFIGGTGSGPPSSGTWALRDFCIDAKGIVYVCWAAGTPGSWLQVGKNGFFYIREFGAKTDGVTNDNQAFIDAMAVIQATATPGFKFQNGSGTFQGGTQANGGGTLLLDAGSTLINNIVTAHRAAIVGHCFGSGILQASGATGPVITNRRDTIRAKFCTVANLRINGQNSGGSTNHGILWAGDETNTYDSILDEDYDERHTVKGVDIIKCLGDGIRMTGAGRNAIHDVTIRNVGKNGVNSFQDNNIELVDVGWAGEAAFLILGDDNRLSTNKGWYSGQTDATKGHGFWFQADSGVASACSAQDNSASGFLWDNAFGYDCKALMADSNSRGSAGTYPQYSVYASSNNEISGTARNRYNAGGPGTVAFNISNGSLQNKVSINAATGVWGTTTLHTVGSSISGNEVTFGANAKGWVNLAAVSNTFTPNPLQGKNFRLAALAANSTVANPSWKWDGAEIKLRIVQNGTGGYTVTGGADFETGFFSGVNTAASAVTILTGIYSSTTSKWEKWS